MSLFYPLIACVSDWSCKRKLNILETLIQGTKCKYDWINCNILFWKKKNLIEHFSVSGWAAIVTTCTNSKCGSSSYSTYSTSILAVNTTRSYHWLTCKQKNNIFGLNHTMYVMTTCSFWAFHTPWPMSHFNEITALWDARQSVKKT